MYWKITEDLLWEEGDSLPSRVGFHSRYDENTRIGEFLDVRLLDDDREHYYSAVADDEALESLYDWAMRDAGVTILQVKDSNGNWKDEIG